MYEIGTSPYFTNVAPGEVTDLPVEAAPQGPSEADHARRTVYTNGQQEQDREGAQIEVHPVQYQPLQPGNPEVLVVDDTDINVDGGSKGEELKCFFHWCTIIIILSMICSLFIFINPFYVFSVLIRPGHMCEQ